MAGFRAVLQSSLHGPLETRRVSSRAEAFKAMLELAVECLAREGERRFVHNEVVSITVEPDPERP